TLNLSNVAPFAGAASPAQSNRADCRLSEIRVHDIPLESSHIIEYYQYPWADLIGPTFAQRFVILHQTITVNSGIITEETVGTHMVKYEIDTTGLASAEAFGTAQHNLNIHDVGNIASAEAFGN